MWSVVLAWKHGGSPRTALQNLGVLFFAPVWSREDRTRASTSRFYTDGLFLQHVLDEAGGVLSQEQVL